MFDFNDGKGRDARGVWLNSRGLDMGSSPIQYIYIHPVTSHTASIRLPRAVKQARREV